MQLHLPIFPKEALLITPSLAVYEQKGQVYYAYSGMPIFNHGSGDLNQFRYITSNLIHQGLCRQVDIVRTFHVSIDSVRRSLIKFEKEGFKAFVEKDGRHGRSYKMDSERLKRIQKKLDRGASNSAVARRMYPRGASVICSNLES
jgi:hypothetical protein